MNRMVIKTILIIGLVMSISWSQDFEMAWENYITLSTRLKIAVESERRLIARQNDLRKEIQALRGNQSWYNGWINEMKVARRSDREVELADSLQKIQHRITILKTQQAEAFLAFKAVYRKILLESARGNELSRSEKERAIIIGRKLINRKDGTVDLPDYSAILQGPYEKEAVRRLVLNDLQSMLQGKIILIDSLISEKEIEVALLNRLNEFHRDLSYQQKSNIDPGRGDQRARSMSMTPDNEPNDDLLTNFSDEGINENKFFGERALFETPLNQSQVVNSDISLPLDIEPIDLEMNLLVAKRQQYQELLRQITAELHY